MKCISLMQVLCIKCSRIVAHVWDCNLEFSHLIKVRKTVLTYKVTHKLLNLSTASIFEEEYIIILT